MTATWEKIDKNLVSIEVEVDSRESKRSNRQSI